MQGFYRKYSFEERERKISDKVHFSLDVLFLKYTFVFKYKRLFHSLKIAKSLNE